MNNRLLLFLKSQFLLLIVMGAVHFVYAQQDPINLEDGFPLLEQGEYHKAKSHFQQYLAYHPQNKTAQICYGRAVGLGGEPQIALGHFKQMDTQFPQDMEVGLNLAEAYLWNSQYEKAKTLYQKLLAKEPKNFAANLGYANSLSNLKEHTQAYQAIKSTRSIDPENQSAKISNKYINLGYASYLAFQQYQYDSAFHYLEEVLELFAGDHEAQMLKASIYNSMGSYDQALKLYEGLNKQKVYAFMGQSVSAHMLKKNKSALQHALKAYQLTLTPEDSIYWKPATQNLIMAYLWNKEFKEAHQYLDLLKDRYPDDPGALLSEAQYYTYQADIDQAIPLIEQHLALLPQSFAGNLSMADAHHGLGLDKLAYQWGYQTLDFHPGQPDALKFIEKLNSQHAPYMDAEFSYQEDSDNSYTKSYGINGKANLSPQLSIAVGFRQDFAGKKELDEETEAQYLDIKTRAQLSKLLAVNLQLGRVKVDLPELLDYAGTVGQLSGELRLSKLQKLEIGVKRELQSFNQALLEQQIFMDHVFLRNNMYWPKSGWGWYTEAFKTWQSDDNQRNLVFTSFYKNILSRPKLKTGVNLLHLGFQEQFPELYYSPESVTSLEGFAEVIQGDLQDNKWQLVALLAAGYQFGDDKQPIFRTQASISRKFGQRLKVKLFGQYSTITAVVSNGFSFYKAGINISYKLSPQPIFELATPNN